MSMLCCLVKSASVFLGTSGRGHSRFWRLFLIFAFGIPLLSARVTFWVRETRDCFPVVSLNHPRSRGRWGRSDFGRTRNVAKEDLNRILSPQPEKTEVLNQAFRVGEMKNEERE